MVNLTDRAVEEIKRITLEQNMELDKIYLRVRIVGGGCSGFSVKLDIDENADEIKDIISKINGINVAMDKRSALYLDDIKIDFIDQDLNRRGFFVDIPAAKSRCGCGSSFSF